MAGTEHYDAIIVGGGIGGGALATVLARAGKHVLVLEKSTVYRDVVRGEWIANWGVAELQTLGLYDDFRAAGGHHVTRHRSYGDAVDPAEAAELPLGALLPGVPGPLTIGHPASCALLERLAREAGATVLRRVTRVTVRAGASPSVRYEYEGAEHEATCRIIVGADGRGSSVRQQLGIELHTDPQHHFFSGMLVEGIEGWPEDLQAIGAEKDVHYLVFPQGNGRARLYLGYPSDQPSRLAGADGPRAFLDAFRLESLPGSEGIATGKPAGPCNSFPNQSSWTDRLCVEGAVLIGDAAGYNDPITGQGLSITYRDVRLVRDALLSHDDWGRPEIFDLYAEERRERMRRLRISAQVQSVIENEFGEEARARRRRVHERQAQNPMLRMPQLATIIGPEKVPAEVFEDGFLEGLFA